MYFYATREIVWWLNIVSQFYYYIIWLSCVSYILKRRVVVAPCDGSNGSFRPVQRWSTWSLGGSTCRRLFPTHLDHARKSGQIENQNAIRGIPLNEIGLLPACLLQNESGFSGSRRSAQLDTGANVPRDFHSSFFLPFIFLSFQVKIRH